MAKRAPKNIGSLVLLVVAAFIAYTFNNAFMILSPLIVLEMGGGIEAGLQGTLYIAAAIVFRFIFGPMGDKYGVKPLLLLGFVAFALSSIAMAFCSQVWQFIVLRCIQAIGFATILPNAAATVAILAPAGKKGQYLGLYRLVSSSSLLIGPPLVIALAKAGGYRTGILLLFSLILVALVTVSGIPGRLFSQLPDDSEIKTETGACPEENKLSTAGTTSTTKLKGDSIARIMRESVAQNTSLIIGVLGAVFVAAVGYGLLITFAAPYLDGARYDINSGLFFTIVGLGGLVANPLAGWASDRLNHKRILSVSFLCLGSGIALLGIVDYGMGVFFLSGILAGLGYSATTTTVLAVIAKRTSVRHYSSVLSLQQNGIDIGIACASGGYGIVFNLIERQGAVFSVQGLIILLIGVALLVSALRPTESEK